MVGPLNPEVSERAREKARLAAKGRKHPGPYKGSKTYPPAPKAQTCECKNPWIDKDYSCFYCGKSI